MSLFKVQWCKPHLEGLLYNVSSLVSEALIVFLLGLLSPKLMWIKSSLNLVTFCMNLLFFCVLEGPGHLLATSQCTSLFICKRRREMKRFDPVLLAAEMIHLFIQMWGWSRLLLNARTLHRLLSILQAHIHVHARWSSATACSSINGKQSKVAHGQPAGNYSQSHHIPEPARCPFTPTHEFSVHAN